MQLKLPLLFMLPLFAGICFVHSTDLGTNGPAEGNTGDSGSAHGPNWDYSWGWGAGPGVGWGYGSGSGHSPTGSGRGAGFGFGTGSGGAHGSGYGFGSGGGNSGEVESGKESNRGPLGSKDDEHHG